MIIGFKGDASRLKELYKYIGFKEVKANTFEEIEELVNNTDGNTVIANYNEIMVFENPTADLVEKRNKVLKALKKSKKNILLSLTKDDLSVDKLQLDYCICTKVDTKDMKLIEEIYNFCNTDLPYSGKLNDGECAVRSKIDNRALPKTFDEIKKIFK